jgi:hypothetical protein
VKEEFCVKCFHCESDARAACRFCGRAVCNEHVQTGVFCSGFGQKIKDNIWPSGSETGVIVEDAVWCGLCKVKYQKTY